MCSRPDDPKSRIIVTRLVRLENEAEIFLASSHSHGQKAKTRTHTNTHTLLRHSKINILSLRFTHPYLCQRFFFFPPLLGCRCRSLHLSLRRSLHHPFSDGSDLLYNSWSCSCGLGGRVGFDRWLSRRSPEPGGPPLPTCTRVTQAASMCSPLRPQHPILNAISAWF